jgi:hypothetical protein
VGELLLTLRRHNARPNHLHVVIEAPGFHKLITSLYPEGDPYLSSDVTFGVKKSLVVVSMNILHYLRRLRAFFCFLFALGADWLTISPERNLLKLTMKPRRENVDSRTAPNSSCSTMTLSSPLRTNGQQRVPNGRTNSTGLLLKVNGMTRVIRIRDKQYLYGNVELLVFYLVDHHDPVSCSMKKRSVVPPG